MAGRRHLAVGVTLAACGSSPVLTHKWYDIPLVK